MKLKPHVKKLRDYLTTTGMSQTAFGVHIGASHPRVWQWLNDKRPIPGPFAIEIEKLTCGQITRHDCRPDLYPESNTRSN